MADVRELKRSGVPDVKYKKDRRWRKGLVILGVTGAVVGGLYAVATPFILPAFRRVCLPYVPATTAQVDNVFSVLKRASTSTSTTNQTLNAVRGTEVRKILVDLGSGDGRIVIEGAKQGYHGVGYELNPWLVWYSRIASRQAGMKHRTSFHRTNLWNVDLSKFDVIVIFGVSQMMAALESKISAEMKPSTLVVACRFPIPDWEPHLCEGTGVDEVWLYRASSKNVTGVRTEVSSSEVS
ncbi:ATP synthase subunit C lysine N-methyltransferase-like [Lytechinus pictus]|uniref:ATP synthase subunit C lysine N-methyltransferase-like n=1 Tax=Lytechinus pictus TaxID=7653 RepID=UPI0030BA1491